MEQLQITCEPAAKNEKASHADETKKPIVDVPKSYKLTSTPEMGRFIVAARSIKAGEIIFKEKPLASAANALSEHVCFACNLVFTKPFYCRDCNSPLCNKNCKMSAEHQRDCVLLRKIKHLADQDGAEKIRLSLLLLPLRCLMLRVEQPEKWNLFTSLVDHVEERRGIQIWNIIEKKVTPYLKIMLEDQMPDLDNELVQKVCGVIDVNAFEIRIPMAIIRAHSPNPFINSHDSLKGAFYEAALMNHSCVPNAQIAIGTDQVMSVIAQVPIKEDEPVVISYTDPLQTTLYRRNFLLNGKYFVCKCKRCVDPTELGTFLSAIKCPKCPNGAVLPRSESDKLRWACGVCSQEMAEDAAVRMEEVVQNIVRNIQQLPIDRYLMDRCEDLFLTLPKKLHTNHALLMQLRVHLMQLYGNVPGFLIPEMSPVLLKRKANLCYEVLEVLRKICPGYSRIRGVALYDFHQPLVILASKKFENGNTNITQLIKDLRDAEAVLKEAVDILVLEPVSSPEATICRAAMNDLKQLRDYIREMEELKKSGIVG